MIHFVIYSSGQLDNEEHIRVRLPIKEDKEGLFLTFIPEDAIELAERISALINKPGK